MKTLILLLALTLSATTQAQISKVSLQASGLTCSMCNNSINKSLKTISFVEKVTPNIKTSTFEILFKPGSQIDFELLKKKVEAAGFTVSNFVATVNFNKTPIRNDQSVKVGNTTIKILNARDQVLNGSKDVRIVNKGFVTGKEFKKSNYNLQSGKDVYHATI